MFRLILSCAQVAQALLGGAQEWLTLGPGQSGTCSRPEVKTEPVRKTVESDLCGSRNTLPGSSSSAHEVYSA
jgi:hypothetical protein